MLAWTGAGRLAPERSSRAGEAVPPLGYRADIDGSGRSPWSRSCYSTPAFPRSAAASSASTCSRHLRLPHHGEHPGSLGRRPFSVIDFYARRIRRIFPALFAMLLGRQRSASSSFFPATLPISAGRCRRDGVRVERPVLARDRLLRATAEQELLLHTWSLGVEEQFYVVFPLLMYLLFRAPEATPGSSSRRWRSRSRWPSGACGTSRRRRSTWRRRAPGSCSSARSWPRARSRPTGTAGDAGRPLAARPRPDRVGRRRVLVVDALTGGERPRAVPRRGPRDPRGCRRSVVAGRPGVEQPAGRVRRAHLLLALPVALAAVSAGEVLRRARADRCRGARVLLLSVLVAAASWRFVERPFRERRLLAARPRLFAAAGLATARP
jgi:hypothetical protein